MIEKIRVLVIPLLVVCVVAAAGLGFTYEVTKERIVKQEKEREAEALAESLPEIQSPNELKESKSLAKKVRKKISSNQLTIEKVFTSKEGNVFVLRSRGYGGMMTLAIGIDSRGKVAGVSVVYHNETPGLGGNLEKPQFLKQFVGKDTRSRLEIGKDVQALAGATFTTRGVTRAVKSAIYAFKLLKGEEN